MRKPNMHPLIGFLLYLFLLLSIPITDQKTMFTQYRVEIENVLPCENNDKLESPMRNIVFQSINRTVKALSYDIEFKRPLDEKIGGLAVLEKWGNAGWVSIPFMPFYPDVCHTMLRYFRDTWIEYNKALGVKQPEKCPVPAGKYKMRNYILDLTAVKVPTWVGKYRFRQMFQLVQTRKTIFCSKHMVNIKEIL